ncbi:MAG: hypothetical protein AB7U20_02220 [Planctomycetaceae bacterium]
MSDAHQSVRHLLRQLEERRTDRPRGLQLPEWLERFIEDVAEHFEPEIEAARAGYVCSCSDDGWRVTLFLGTIEVVGGPDDGANLPAGFRFDLEAVRSRFDRMDRIIWEAFPAGCQGNPSGVDDSRVAVEGVLNGQRIHLQVSLRPPANVGPGLLKNANGCFTRAE